MVSFHLCFLAFALVAVTTAYARPETWTAPPPAGLLPLTRHQCKTILINKGDKDLVQVINKFKKKNPSKIISSDLTFTSPVDETNVYFFEKGGANVFKSDSDKAPLMMRFKLSYETGNEYSYIQVEPKEHCIVQGSDQWPNLVQVDYVKRLEKEKSIEGN